MTTERTEATPPAVLAGVSQAVPIVLGYVPIGLAFGVLAQKAGLSPLITLVMSIVVYAGSAQLIAVGLLAAGVPPLSIVVTTFVVNLRHLLMSAALAPFLRNWSRPQLAAFAYELTDETFAVHAARFATRGARAAEALATNVTAQAAWVTGTALGILLGSAIADVEPLGLDYTLPAMFIALLVMQIRDRVQVLVAVLTGALAVALLLAGMARWHVVVATLAGATFGLGLEQWIGKRPS
jgi:4-azaleucine resistance transporter AzlC